MAFLDDDVRQLVEQPNPFLWVSSSSRRLWSFFQPLVVSQQKACPLRLWRFHLDDTVCWYVDMGMDGWGHEC